MCDLIEPVGLSQPTVSHHLRYSSTPACLTRSKRGTWAYYRLVPGALDLDRPAARHSLSPHYGWVESSQSGVVATVTLMPSQRIEL